MKHAAGVTRLLWVHHSKEFYVERGVGACHLPCQVSISHSLMMHIGMNTPVRNIEEHLIRRSASPLQS